MIYEEFLEAILDETRTACKEGDEVQLQKIMKTNGMELDAMIIRRTGSNLSPTIYLKPCYEEYLNGTSIPKLAQKLLEWDESLRPEQNIDVTPYMNRDYCLEHVGIRLVNTARNQNLLLAVPHREFMDLSLMYYLKVSNIMGNEGSILLYNRMISQWDITEMELYEHAMNNMNKQKAVVECITQLVRDLYQESPDHEELMEKLDQMEEDETQKIYVLTNKEKYYGANMLLLESPLKDFAKEHGSFYILPSSMHELICVPEIVAKDAGELLEMVRCVNETVLDESEFLSNNIYWYDSEEEVITCIEEAIHAMD